MFMQYIPKVLLMPSKKKLGAWELNTNFQTQKRTNHALKPTQFRASLNTHPRCSVHTGNSH